MVLTVYLVLSPATGLFCRRHPREDSRELDASVGASGPYALTVRVSAVRQRRIRVHRIPARVRDDRETPLSSGGTAALLHLIWVFGKSEYFCKRGWTGQISLNRLAKFDFTRKRSMRFRRSDRHSGMVR
jgi:hypothetical protein